MRTMLLIFSLFSVTFNGKAAMMEPFYTELVGTERFFLDSLAVLTPEQAEKLQVRYWYFSFPLKSTSGKSDDTNNCLDIKNKFSQGYTARNSSDYSAFLATISICHSWEIMSKLKPSKKSFLGESIINEALPSETPSDLAFIISDEQTIKANKMKFWSNMDNIVRFERITDHQGVYFDDSDGYQKVTLVATGDYNADGIEDAIVIKENSVLTGSYVSTHGYVLTRDSENAPFKILTKW
ncbi:hypothetical protein [Vibrio navarrensis]|uniref:hypothetical protein n=1 Tax=Vibrio navarrensis TaxID=29495 RepID=UPI001302E4D4|nr:hypothetical protein [Vibrio navarrensis]